MVKKVSHPGNLVKFSSLGGDSSQNLVILVKLEPSEYFLNVQNSVWGNSVTPRDVLVAKRQSEVRRRHLKLPMGALSGTNFEVSVESKFMTSAGNFFEPWVLPRLHPGRPTRSLRLEKEGFWSLPSVQKEY